MKPSSDPIGLFLCAGLDRNKIRQFAFETGFCKRASRKIDAPDFLIQPCLQSVAGTVSHNDLAARVGAHAGICASRQAYWERTDESFVRFFQSVLEHVMLSRSNPETIATRNRRVRFNRILLQDSTIGPAVRPGLALRKKRAPKARHSTQHSSLSAAPSALILSRSPTTA